MRAMTTIGVPSTAQSEGRASHLRSAETAENFPVALRVLPSALRRDLTGVYDVLRVIDDLGDVAGGDRTRLLQEFAADLARVWSDGTPDATVLRRLVPTVHARRLQQAEFDRLIAANLQDQRVHEYRTFAELRDYCRLSADPVGRLVLAVFGQEGEGLGELSDRVCTALQLIEHWQDVGEDRRNGRIYLPLEDRLAFGVEPEHLDANVTPLPVRRLLAFEAERAEALLAEGSVLIPRLNGWARLAVAGYVAGGQAALDALKRAGFDVLSSPPGPRRRDVLAHLAANLYRSFVDSRRPVR